MLLLRGRSLFKQSDYLFYLITFCVYIAGFQFYVSGVNVISAGGGDAADAGFSMSTGNNFNIQTRKNGAIQLYNYDTVFTTGWQYMSFTNYVNCNANDYLQIYYGGSNVFGADQGSGQWGELYFWLAQ